MNRKNLILVGVGGHATSCIDVIEQENRFKIAGLIGLKHEVGKKIHGYEVIASDSDLKNIKKEFDYVHIAVGQLRSAILRKTLYSTYLKVGFLFPTIVSPFSYVSPNSQIGNGTLISHGVIINSGVKIGENCIINTRALIEHGTIISDHCHIATGVIINGDTVIESGCFIGSGSVLRHSIIVESNKQISMGKVVKKTLKPIDPN